MLKNAALLTVIYSLYVYLSVQVVSVVFSKVSHTLPSLGKQAALAVQSPSSSIPVFPAFPSLLPVSQTKWPRMCQFHLFPVTNVLCVQSDLGCELWWMCLDRLEIYSTIQMEKAKLSNSDSLTTVERAAKKIPELSSNIYLFFISWHLHIGLVTPTQARNNMIPS